MVQQGANERTNISKRKVMSRPIDTHADGAFGIVSNDMVDLGAKLGSDEPRWAYLRGQDDV